MRKLFTLLVFGTMMYSGSIMGQFVTIPDPNFVIFLNNNGYSAAMNGNQMDTTNTVVQNASSIDCSNGGISDLEGIQYFPSLQLLNCSSNPLTTLPAFYSQLYTLDISNCNFNILQSIPLTVTTLFCRDNQATNLPSIPPNMMILDCGGNLLTSLPSLPSNLVELYCDSMLLTQLPALPFTLEKLVCGYNQLTSLPLLPNGLQEISCNSNQLTALPILPITLNQLDCRDNLITTLPTLFSISFLACGENLFTSFPALPIGLVMLHCSNSLVTGLPLLPSTLISLTIDNSPLTTLPPFPAGLASVDVSNCQLTSLPELPAIMTKLWAHNNPSLECLPLLTQINDLTFYNTSVNCLPNYGSVGSSNPLLFSLPLCDIYNINGCASYYNIAGQVYFDANSNCFKEPSENSGNNIKINVFQGGNLMQQVYTSQDGFYSIDAPLGTYDYAVDTIGKPYLVSCPPTGQLTSILTSTDSIDTGMNFGIECKPGFDIGVYSVSLHNSSFFPGDTAEVFIKAGDMALIYNMNCANSVAGTLHIDFSGAVSYIGPAPGSLTPAIGGNSLDYAVADFGTIDPDSAFRFYLLTDTSAQNGQPVCLNINVTPTSGDQDTSNNFRAHCFVINTSLDPNNKEVNPPGDITANQDWLYYTINFQNTGTTTAQHVVVTDTLDPSLREASFIFLGASHNVFVQVDNNIARFIFPNINLPDSASSQQGSRGQILYKINLDPGLPIGTIINNTAAIYFDFNPPVMTNTTINTIVNPSSITEAIPLQVTLYPNPTNNNIYVNYASTDCNYSIIEQTGRIVLEGKLINGTNRIVTEKLAAGIYMIQIDSENSVHYQKFAISR